jgi:hypothetical protein
MENQDERKTDWSDSIESLVKTIAEQSECYTVLHRNSEKLYSYLNHFIQIPVIILCAVTGSANFLFGSSDKTATSIIGGVSILTGIVQTIGTYFRFAQLSESHKISYISYEKLFNHISTELALPREDRVQADILLNEIRQSIERLQEIAPAIPDKIIEKFKKDYSNYPDVVRPIIANGLISVSVNKEPPKRLSILLPDIVVHIPEEPVPEDKPKPKPKAPFR